RKSLSNDEKNARHGGRCAQSPEAKRDVGYSAGSGQSRLLHEPGRRIDAHPERGVPSWSLAAPGAIDRNPSLPERPMANDQKTNPNRHDTPDHANQKKGEDSYRDDLRKAQEVDPAQGADVRRDHLD